VQALNKNNSQPRLLYPAKLPFITEEVKKKNLKKFMTLNQHCRRYLKEFYMQK
jgi:hypothetical protein